MFSSENDFIHHVFTYCDHDDYRNLFFVNKDLNKIMYNIPYMLYNYYGDKNIYDFYESGYSEKSILPFVSTLMNKDMDMKFHNEHIYFIIKNDFKICFRLFHQNLPIMENEYIQICHNGRFELLQYLYEIDDNKSNIIDSDLIDETIENDFFDIFKYLIEKGNQLNNHIIESIIREDRVMMLEYVNNYIQTHLNNQSHNICDFSGYSNSPKCLDYLLENHYEYNENMLLLICRFGYIECLKIANKHNCLITHNCYYYLINFNHLDCLIYLNNEYNNNQIKINDLNLTMVTIKEKMNDYLLHIRLIDTNSLNSIKDFYETNQQKINSEYINYSLKNNKIEIYEYMIQHNQLIEGKSSNKKQKI
jgi:hypothetical protein